ncbi:MAG: Flp pilus assembly complex ATPase component TadA [Propionibacteriaceae bacterium]|jgi:Flp pilus assembly CpaF family ATPase|nr:Flp pilus assembly complex ATPase component TadA [Propionibacteriaceae bacterium]
MTDLVETDQTTIDLESLPLFGRWDGFDPHRAAVGEARQLQSDETMPWVEHEGGEDPGSAEQSSLWLADVGSPPRASLESLWPSEPRHQDEPEEPLLESLPLSRGEHIGKHAWTDEVEKSLTPSQASGVNWDKVAAMRVAASTRLSTRLGAERVDSAHQQSIGRAIIADLIDEEAASAISAGMTPWDKRTQVQMSQAVFDALFRLGRLQPLVDDDQIENIVIDGADRVWLERADGTIVAGPPVAGSDEELVSFLSFIASRSQVNARAFSEAEPRLHLRLDGGARLAAAAWVTPRPSVVIRRHRMTEITLSGLVARKTLSNEAARFLAKAVQRRASIVVSGAQGAGKTTLMRALCAEIPPDEIIGTFETEYELHLHEMPDRHRVVFAWEGRPGSGERDAQGHRAGEFLIDDALYDSFRFNLSRQIVGEVRGREILAMLKAMQSGSGSLSTTHANSAEGAIRKLITCAMEAGPHVTAGYATRAIAEDIDLLVHLTMNVDTGEDGQTVRRRRVSEIVAVAPSDSARGYATTRVFSTPPEGGLAVLDTVPEGWEDMFISERPWS